MGAIRGTISASCDRVSSNYSKGQISSCYNQLIIFETLRIVFKSVYLFNLLMGQVIREGLEHFILIFDAELSASLFINTLLPAHVMGLKYQGL